MECINNETLFELEQNKVLYSFSVCSDHFEEQHFQTKEKLKLNRGAVPTTFPISTSTNEKDGTPSEIPMTDETQLSFGCSGETSGTYYFLL
mgnify:FL=1